MNLDEFYHATAGLNPNLTILIAEKKHFLPVTQLLITDHTIHFQTKRESEVPSPSHLNLDQFLTRVKDMPLNYDLRIYQTQKIVFGFRIVGNTLVLY
ncbi:hypothetical protein [Lentilactobacillus sp. Marseille-Q4993]|uniref:hypothetical protein n=1 Tax=Lentilactobacillus sp. Marseille-Q4993 TaxID=3039492 RepID=UPI0024BC3D14|nr:hypothetical protein [Lentilactobacillus sp. Marseille-Q4993]